MATTVGAATVPANPPFAAGAFMWRKLGPLPVWAYGAGLLGLLLLWVWIRRGKAADQNATALASKDAQTIPGNQKSMPVFIVPQSPPPPVNVTNTVPGAPAGSGRDNPPGSPIPMFLSPGAGTDLYKFAYQTQATYGIPLDLPILRQLNPGLDSHISWTRTAPDYVAANLSDNIALKIRNV